MSLLSYILSSGWNWWYLFAPLSIIITAIPAGTIPSFKDGRIIRAELAAKMIKVALFASTAIIAVLFFAESFYGIAQAIKDSIPTLAEDVSVSDIIVGAAFLSLVHLGINYLISFVVVKHRIARLHIKEVEYKSRQVCKTSFSRLP